MVEKQARKLIYGDDSAKSKPLVGNESLQDNKHVCLLFSHGSILPSDVRFSSANDRQIRKS